MKHELALGITVTSLLATGAFAATPVSHCDASSPCSVVSHGGGKCASGKCGTEKIYSKTKLEHDPNGVLVRARDGKCGLSGKGHDVTESNGARLAEGVCGR